MWSLKEGRKEGRKEGQFHRRTVLDLERHHIMMKTCGNDNLECRERTNERPTLNEVRKQMVVEDVERNGTGELGNDNVEEGVRTASN